ncbi:MAG: glycosyltransferase [Anaerolineales bacterium]|nr:glycosyltransferase [Anaerolineales bacterium]
MATRLLIVSHEAPGERMSGPAIRYWQLAQALAAGADAVVTLAAPRSPQLSPSGFHLAGFDRDTGAGLEGLLAEADALLVSGYLLRHYPALARAPQPCVVDLYDPFVLENLEIHANRPLPDQAAQHRVDLAVQVGLLRRGDFFVCASEPQRDFWLGMLAGAGRLNPYTFAADPALRALIDVVPFGVPDEPPAPGPAALKGVVSGIAPADQVVYWGGGLWDWFDPLTALRAVAALAARRPNLRLVFAGVRHPNPAVPPMRRVAETLALSDSLGLTGKHVFFGEWVPYAQRARYLQDADVALSLHLDHVETRFAFRTRLLDYLWTARPMVLTAGDTLAAEFAAQGLARLVPPGNMAAVAAAIEAWLDTPAAELEALRQKARVAAEARAWSRVVAPLAAFLRGPRLAPDRAAPASAPRLSLGLVGKAWQVLRARGPAAVLRDVRLYLRR